MRLFNKLRISDDLAASSFGKIKFQLDGEMTDSSAFELHNKVKEFFYLPRALGIYDVKINIYDMNCEKLIFSYTIDFCELESCYDVYSLDIPVSNLGVGLYFYTVGISTVCGFLYAKQSMGRLCFLRSDNPAYNQFSVSHFKYKAATKYYGGVIYHIFVDRFFHFGDNVKKDEAVLLDDWNADIPEFPLYPGAPLKNNYFYGGNLKGITKKLDYIKSLGVNIIYLSPIFESPSNHKYDTSDYMKIDSMFGTDEDLSELIATAGKLGIGILLDGVFNHTGADSVYFNKYNHYSSIGAYQSKKSKYFDWYTFNRYPDDYVSWWGIEILPRINPDIPSLRNFFVGKKSVIAKYRDLGIAGLRLDVVDELSDDFVKDIKKCLSKSKAQTLLYGEVWEDGSNKIAYGKRKTYYLGDELDGVMNYPLRDGIILYLRNSDTEKLLYALTEIMSNTPKRILNTQMNIIGSHDTVRIITALAGESAEGRDNMYLSKARMSDEEKKIGIKKVMMAYTVCATLPGIPSIYYGDEAGVEGYSDPFNRKTFPWGDENKELVSHFSKLGSIRGKYPVYKNSDFELVKLSDKLFIFKRTYGNYSYVTVVNNNSSVITVSFGSKAKSLINNLDSKDFLMREYTSDIFRVKKGTVANVF